MNETRQTLDQIRAKLAWDYVQRSSEPEKFATACKRMSSRILTSGLGSALAFTMTKSEDEHRLLASALAERLSGDSNAAGYMKRLIESDANRLRRDTEEAMSFLTWLARLAVGRCKRDKRTADDQRNGGQ